MDLFIDGYIAQTFGPRGAAPYFTRLLGLEAQILRPIVSQAWPHAFFITSPVIPNVPPSLSINGKPAWLLDYSTRQVGTVVPQRIWSPGYSPDSQRYVHPLKLPIFFVHKDRVNLGLPLLKAAAGNCETLLDAKAAAPVGNPSTMYIRINWPGYSEWTTQRMTRDQTSEHNTISLEKFAKRLASAVSRFLDEAQSNDGENPNWRVGVGGVTKDQVILIGAVQVSQGSWQPILQLNRYVVLRCQIIPGLP